MNLRDHNHNLKIIGKVFVVIGLILIPVSLFSFFFIEAFKESDFWMEVDDINILFLHIRAPQNALYLFPLFHFIVSLIFLSSGLGLALEKPWGKKVAMVPAVLLLFQFPIGTAVAIYMIYAIHSDNGGQDAVEAS